MLFCCSKLQTVIHPFGLIFFLLFSSIFFAIHSFFEMGYLSFNEPVLKKAFKRFFTFRKRKVFFLCVVISFSFQEHLLNSPPKIHTILPRIVPIALGSHEYQLWNHKEVIVIHIWSIYSYKHTSKVHNLHEMCYLDVWYIQNVHSDSLNTFDNRGNRHF